MSVEIIKIISSVVGIIGGFLGFIVFIDNYFLKFNPKFRLSNSVYFKFSNIKNYPVESNKILDFILIKIEIFNRRNKIGRLDDFAVRIYDSYSTAPQASMFFAKNELEALPESLSELMQIKKSPFSPISILNKSNHKISLEFTPDKYMSFMVNPKGSIKIDLMYNSMSSGWVKVGTYALHDFSHKKDKEDYDSFIEYELLDLAVKRRDACSILDTPQTGIYKGISGKYLGYYLKWPIFKLKEYLIYPIKLLKLMLTLLKISVVHIFFAAIIFPLIKYKSKKLPHLSFSPARSHLIDTTDKMVDFLHKNIEKHIQEINKETEDKAKISLTTSRDGFNISRAGLSVKFYKSGDGYITVSDTGNHPHKIYFKITLDEYPVSVKLWKINGKVMSKKSICIHVLDSFVLLAH